MKMPYMKKPCLHCPYRKDIRKGWLGEGVVDYINAPSFVCHKTIHGELEERKQCAGHMLLRPDDNVFLRMARVMGEHIDISGKELIFDSVDACIEHHTREDDE